MTNIPEKSANVSVFVDVLAFVFITSYLLKNMLVVYRFLQNVTGYYFLSSDKTNEQDVLFFVKLELFIKLAEKKSAVRNYFTSFVTLCFSLQTSTW